MSKIGKKPISIPSGVSVKENRGGFYVSGPKGTITVPFLPGIIATLSPELVILKIEKDGQQSRMNWGTLRSLLQNAILGVTDGFSKRLEIEGIGFRAAVEGNILSLKVGFSHPVKFPIPEGISVVVEKNKIIVSGVEKALVGQIAADIRKVKKPEPYLGKGIRYEKEVIRRKEGKKAGAGAVTATK